MEIGSEFWDVPCTDKAYRLFNNSISWYLSGRAALRAVIKDMKEHAKVHTVAMPSWCCHTMIQPFLDAGLEVNFYPVYYLESLIQDISTESDVLFVMDYFGYTGEKSDLSLYKGIVIRDVSHSVFSNAYSDADYYFGSLRKWCGIWTGGYAWTRDHRKLLADDHDDHGYTGLRMKAMELKSSYISAPKTHDKEYLNVFNDAEALLDDVGIVPAAERDVRLAQKLDFVFIKNKRRTNAEILRKAFPQWLVFHEMKPSDCPMFVPVIVPDGKRDELRRYLMEREIYCPVHWPVSDCHKLDERELYVYQNGLSLVCDQRYDEKDMRRIVDTINTFMEG